MFSFKSLVLMLNKQIIWATVNEGKEHTVKKSILQLQKHCELRLSITTQLLFLLNKVSYRELLTSIDDFSFSYRIGNTGPYLHCKRNSHNSFKNSTEMPTYVQCILPLTIWHSPS